MSWQERIVSLSKRFGPAAAKTAVKTLLSTLVPGGVLLSELVEGAFSAVDKGEQEARDVAIHQGLQATAEAVNRLEQALQIVEDNLGDLLAQVVQHHDQPEVIAQMLDYAKANDNSRPRGNQNEHRRD